MNVDIAKLAETIGIKRIRVERSKITADVTLDRTGFQQGLVKIALGAGHLVLGSVWSQSAQAYSSSARPCFLQVLRKTRCWDLLGREEVVPRRKACAKSSRLVPTNT
jgi:hypothetical protein